MKALILDEAALRSVAPAAISAYARDFGWRKTSPYREHADVYELESNPTLILPRTDRLVDYAATVSSLIEIFSETTNQDELTILRTLLDAEHDIIRFAVRSAAEAGTIPIDDGVELVAQAREVMLSAACATRMPQPVYRSGANKEANDFMRKVRLGQTEHGSFVVTLLTYVPPSLQPSLPDTWADFAEEPMERQVTRRLFDALNAIRISAELAVSGDAMKGFEGAVERGVSANLCEALAKIIDASETLEIGLDWARTRPVPVAPARVGFSTSDAGILREAARNFRAKQPRPGVTLYGLVHKLTRNPESEEGSATFKAEVDGQVQSVSAVLSNQNFDSAINALRDKHPVIVTGDLERVGQRWRVENASVRVIPANVGDEESTDAEPDEVEEAVEAEVDDSDGS